MSGKANGSYGYRVRACAGAGVGNCSAYSATGTIVVTIPPAPVTLTRTYTYNSYQELCSVVEPETGATLMGYDAAGNLEWSASGLPASQPCESSGTSTLVDPRRVVRTYDFRNRVATLTFPDANGTQSWSYTDDGLPASVTTYNDAGATQVVNGYTYNKRRLLTGEQQISGSNTWSVGYGYDANAHLSTLVYPENLTSAGSRIVAYAPNALGQPTQAGTYATNVTYYSNGAIAGFTYGNGIVHTLTQNARGLPDRSKDLDGSTPVHDDSYDYDAVGNVLAISDAVSGNRGHRDMTYDALNRLTLVTGADGAPSPMFGIASYDYDVLDNLTHVQVTGGSQSRNQDYCYDTSNRLTNVKTGGCGGTSVVGLGYDVQGNLNNRSGVLFGFDYGNRMRTGGPESYRYDVQGRRIRSSSSAGVIDSLYAQSGQLLFQRDGRSGKRRQYIYLGGSLVAESDMPLTGSTVTVTYQHTDALGSPVATTDSAKTVLQRSEYEPYGYLLNRPMEDGPGYTGHVTDAATGLVYMQQRYMDPLIGQRFLSVDPVTAYSDPIGEFNRYRYANNNPFRFSDPDGRLSWDDVKNFVKGVVIQIADSALSDAHYSSVNPTVVEAYPGELSIAGQCGCEYKSPFPQAATNEEQLGRDVAPAVTIVGALVTGKFLGEAAEGAAAATAKGLGGNPFKGKTSEQIAEMLIKKGYEPKGADPVAGQGTFLNPSTGRSVHIDANHPPPKPPHVSVQRPRGGRKQPPRAYPLE